MIDNYCYLNNAMKTMRSGTISLSKPHRGGEGAEMAQQLYIMAKFLFRFHPSISHGNTICNYYLFSVPCYINIPLVIVILTTNIEIYS